ncbi:MAG: adenosylcobinamide-phosphate synthase CbiB [Victivallaceae bacterium]|jgi:adenosylcobinamide-phosphate synthase
MELLYILAGALLFDLLLGDPRVPYHPVAVTGRSALALENYARHIMGGTFIAGMLCACVITGTTALIALALVAAALKLGVIAGIAVAAFLVYITIAPRSLVMHAEAVKRPLLEGNLELARKKVAMIVSRDTSVLDERGVVRSCVESLGENVIDGVTSALFFAAAGWLLWGIPGAAAAACFYRASNTLDATYGYRNERYRHFGTFAARLDDVLNFIPARLTLVAIFLASLIGGFRPFNAVRCAWRDHGKHPSPNSNWGMSAFAGALGVKLGGRTFYHGQWEDYPEWGIEFEPLTVKHIARTQRLVILVTLTFAALCAAGAMIIKAM